MPQATSAANGAVPVIAANAARTELILQNNSGKDVRVRIYGPVSLVTPGQSGLLLRADGGFLSLQGADAQRPIYAHTADSSTVILDYDSNVVS